MTTINGRACVVNGTPVDKVFSNGRQVYGRNLLIGTSENEVSGKFYLFHNYQISGGLQPGTTYTLSGWGRVDQDCLNQSKGNRSKGVFIVAYYVDWSWSVTLWITPSLTSQYGKINFTTPSGKQFNPYVSVYIGSTSGTGYISKLKLEKGTTATPWTPAPEDVGVK